MRYLKIDEEAFWENPDELHKIGFPGVVLKSDGLIEVGPDDLPYRSRSSYFVLGDPADESAPTAIVLKMPPGYTLSAPLASGRHLHAGPPRISLRPGCRSAPRRWIGGEGARVLRSRGGRSRWLHTRRVLRDPGGSHDRRISDARRRPPILECPARRAVTVADRHGGVSETSCRRSRRSSFGPFLVVTGRLDGQVLLVIGGGVDGPGRADDIPMGNGRAAAIVCAREGAAVVVADRDLNRAEETVALIRTEGHEALAVACDAAEERELHRAVDGHPGRLRSPHPSRQQRRHRGGRIGLRHQRRHVGPPLPCESEVPRSSPASCAPAARSGRWCGGEYLLHRHAAPEPVISTSQRMKPLRRPSVH